MLYSKQLITSLGTDISLNVRLLAQIPRFMLTQPLITAFSSCPSIHTNKGYRRKLRQEAQSLFPQSSYYFHHFITDNRRIDMLHAFETYSPSLRTNVQHKGQKKKNESEQPGKNLSKSTNSHFSSRKKKKIRSNSEFESSEHTKVQKRKLKNQCTKVKASVYIELLNHMFQLVIWLWARLSDASLHLYEEGSTF